LADYYTRLMSAERIPLHVDPQRLSRTGARFNACVSMRDMGRLLPLLAAEPGDVTVGLEFDLDEMQRAYLRLQLQAEVVLVCQRCLSKMKQSIVADRLLGLVCSEEQAERLPESYEPLLITNEPLFLRDVIEDELILSLPIIARHADGECELAVKKIVADTQASATQINPFAALAELNNH